MSGEAVLVGVQRLHPADRASAASCGSGARPGSPPAATAMESATPSAFVSARSGSVW